MTQIDVVGAGAFGTALAISLALAERDVRLWARSPAQVQTMRKDRENTQRLPGVPLPDRITPVADLAELAADIVLLCVPMQQLRSTLSEHSACFAGKTLVACCKGVELSTGLGPVAVISDVIPDARAAILTGPSFADDIARGLPTALTLAAPETVGQTLQKALTTPNLRIYRTTDTIGAELGGALKNVMAIACGIAIGAGLGDSARAAVMTRGYAEMQRMARALKAQEQTLAGLSGFGDLALTCTSPLSRNYRFGLSIGRNEPFDAGVTVEGAATARAARARAAKMGIDMPITEAVVAVLDKKLDVDTALQMLLSRPLKKEEL